MLISYFWYFCIAHFPYLPHSLSLSELCSALNLSQSNYFLQLQIAINQRERESDWFPVTDKKIDIVNTFLSHKVYKNSEDNLSKHNTHYKVCLGSIIATLLTFFFRGNSIIDPPLFFSWCHLKALCTMITANAIYTSEQKCEACPASWLTFRDSLIKWDTNWALETWANVYIYHYSPFSTNSCHMMS